MCVSIGLKNWNSTEEHLLLIKHVLKENGGLFSSTQTRWLTICIWTFVHVGHTNSGIMHTHMKKFFVSVLQLPNLETQKVILFSNKDCCMWLVHTLNGNTS